MKLSELGRALLATFEPLLLFSSGRNQNSISFKEPISISSVQSWPVDLTDLFNNIAVGPNANFDPRGERWDAKLMPVGNLSTNGIEYQLPQNWAGEPDNVVSDGQTVHVPHFVEFPREMHILYAGDFIDGTLLLFTFNFLRRLSSSV